MPDPDLEIRRGGGGDSHPDPEIKEEGEGAGLQKNIFWLFLSVVHSRDSFGPPLGERDVFRRETSEV